MSTPTAARPGSKTGSHWYTVTGEACYEIMGKTTGKPRSVTLKDARELNLLPSVTTILKVLHKEGLVNWMIEQAVLAVMTTPRKEGESDDSFINRVLQVEKVQDQEGRAAADRGTQIHDALEGYFQGREVPDELKPYVMPAAEEIASHGAMVSTERIIVGDGYAGKSDLVLESDAWELIDYKSTRNLPDPKKGGAWLEHRLQLSAYAKGWEEMMATAGADPRPIRTGNVYISSVNPGEYVVCMHPEWETTYIEGFAPLVTYWQWANRYRAKQRETVTRAEVIATVEQSRAQAAEAVPDAYEQSKVKAAAPESPAPQASNQGPADPPQPKNAAGKRVIWTPGIPS